MTITKPRRRVETVEYSRQYLHAGSLSWGFSFACDAAGTVDVAALQPAALENYRACVAGTNSTTDAGVRTYRHAYTHPAEGRCACRRIVVLDGDTRGEGIACDCGRLYNAGGQELAPRSQWDERGDY